MAEVICLAYSGSYRGPGRPFEPAKPPMRRPGPPSDGLSGRLMPLLKKLEAIDLETDDLILLLILYLLYRESGDLEMLILMGAMLFA